MSAGGENDEPADQGRRVRVEVGERSGWQTLTIESADLAVELVPGLGGTITSLRRRSDDLELLWSTPWGLPRPGALSVPGSGEAAMLDTSPGGWQSVFPNGSDNGIVHGVEWGWDGEARIAPLDWEQTSSSVILRGRLRRSPFELSRIVSVRGPEVTVGETVNNVGGEHVDVVWAQQVLLGAAVLGPRTTVATDATTVRSDPRVAPGVEFDDVLPWPRTRIAGGTANLRTVPAADAGQTRAAYLSDFEDHAITVTNPDSQVSVRLNWEGSIWPHLWYGLEAGGASGYPWYSAGYFLSLAPSTSWPARGVNDVRRISATSLRIFPGTSRTAYLSLTVS